MGKSVPASPDYKGAAEAQGAASQGNVNQQTAANRADQGNAYANSSWHQGPDGQWTQSTDFSGPLAGINTGLMGQAGAAMSQPFDNGSAARDQAINAAYGQSVSRLDPQWGHAGESLDAKLANQGLDPNSEAARSAQRDFSRSKNDAYQGAMNSAIGQGTAAQQTTFGQNMAAREMPMQEMQQMAQFLRMPGYSQAGQADTPQYLNAAMGQFNADKANADTWNGINSGYGQAAGQLAGLGLKFALSDERAKMNIVREAAEAIPGVPFATFEYRDIPGRRFRGVIAQDVQNVEPERVRVRPDGLLEVAGFIPQEVGNG